MSSSGVLWAGHQPHPMPLPAVDEAPVAIALGPQAAAHLRVGQAFRGGLVAIGEDPRRQDRGHAAQALGHGDRVGEHVDALAPRPLDAPDGPRPCVLRGSGVGPHVEMGELPAASRGLHVVEELLGRIHDLRRAVADVADVHARVRPHRCCQPPDLVARRAASRVELEARGHAQGARLHRLRDHPLHVAALVLVALGPGQARRGADGVVAHEEAVVDGRAGRAHDVQVGGEGRPGHRLLIAVGAQELGRGGTRGVRGGRLADAAVAHDLRGHALADGALGGRIGQQHPVGVAVGVDEAGRHVTCRWRRSPAPPWRPEAAPRPRSGRRRWRHPRDRGDCRCRRRPSRHG